MRWDEVMGGTDQDMAMHWLQLSVLPAHFLHSEAEAVLGGHDADQIIQTFITKRLIVPGADMNTYVRVQIADDPCLTMIGVDDVIWTARERYVAYWTERIRLSPEADQRPAQLDDVWRWGMADFVPKSFAHALLRFDTAITRTTLLPNPNPSQTNAIATAWKHIAFAEHANGNAETSVACAMQIIALGHATNADRIVFDGQMLLGELYELHRNQRKALAAYEDAERIAIAQKQHHDHLMVLGRIGHLQKRNGDLLLSQQIYERCLQIARSVDDSQIVCETLGMLAHITYERNDIIRAEAHYERWMQAAQAINDRESEAIALAGIGNCAFALGDFLRAKTCFLDARDQLMAVNNESTLIVVLCNLSETFTRMGMVPHALASYHEAFQVAQKIWDSPNGVLVATRIAQIYLFQNDLAQAKAWANIASSFHRSATISNSSR